MKTGKITGWSKKELRDEILGRMDILDTSDEEYSNKELIEELERMVKE